MGEREGGFPEHDAFTAIALPESREHAAVIVGGGQEFVAALQVDAELVARSGGVKYVVEFRAAAEGRADRLTPLMAQTILDARTVARLNRDGAAHLAVVGAPRVAQSVAEKIQLFARLHAPDVAVGVIDSEGLRSFSGPGLEGLNAARPRSRARAPRLPAPLPDLISDLNQWMLKILLCRELPGSLIDIPREPVRNASHLAALARVSVMSAARCISQLRRLAFLDDSSDGPRVARREELLEL